MIKVNDQAELHAAVHGNFMKDIEESFVEDSHHRHQEIVEIAKLYADVYLNKVGISPTSTR